jgi:hypothetical protein
VLDFLRIVPPVHFSTFDTVLERVVERTTNRLKHVEVKLVTDKNYALKEVSGGFNIL